MKGVRELCTKYKLGALAENVLAVCQSCLSNSKCASFFSKEVHFFEAYKFRSLQTSMLEGSVSLRVTN